MPKRSVFLVFLILALVILGALPASAQTVLSVARQPAADTYYTIRPGDTLANIAARYGTTVRVLLNANPQIRNANTIYVGQRILIPTSGGPINPSAQRIYFASGMMSASLEGRLSANGQARYTLRVLAGQTMTVWLYSQQNVLMSVAGADGDVLKSSGAGGPFWSGSVPKTQDYTISITTSDGSPANFTLVVIVPKRISFAAGGTSATEYGVAAPFATHYYIMKVMAGQTLRVDTSTTQGQVIILVYGANGDVYQTDHSGSSSFDQQVMTTQDYTIEVRSVGSRTARYTLTASVPPL